LALPLGQAIPSPFLVDGKWRFTAETERLIRIEYDEEAKFVNDPTSAFVRARPLGNWLTTNVRNRNGWAQISTSAVTLKWNKAKPPSKGSVLVATKDGKFTWLWGDDPSIGNLRGTARTLDSGAETLDLNCFNKVSPTMDNSQMHCTWGLISRQGWAVVNETGMPIISGDTSWYASSRNTTDVFVFMHGLDYPGAMKDFAHAAGAPALVPRYALGSIFTRWFGFDSDDVQEYIDEFETQSLPLDAWIYDMNWHVNGPWGAFTWNRNLYPQLETHLSWIWDRNLAIGVNTHDHDGIRSWEVTYKDMCSALGRPADGTTLDFDLYNKTFAMAQESIAWRGVGVDFAWIDYQQGEDDQFKETKIPNINPTIVLNALRYDDPMTVRSKGTRGMVLSRWGGLGNHRYPVGFSGDQRHTWKALAFLPYFTSTAANVAFGYWSHDTVGAADGDVPNGSSDYELSVRWLQTSAWSPVLRYHDKGEGTGSCSTKNNCARVAPWDVPHQYFKAIRSATQYRDQLVPYMYSAVFEAVRTGLTLTRPMYYESPADDAMYGLDHQYLFGPDMVVSPITAASGTEEVGFEQALGAINWALFAPSSDQWVDALNGDFASGANLMNVYGIEDVPHLVRQGAVIPMRPKPRKSAGWRESSLSRARQNLHDIEFRVWPAEEFYERKAFKGSTWVVDDDGTTTDYLDGKYTNTTVKYQFDGDIFTFDIKQTGTFRGAPRKKRITFSFPQMPPFEGVDGADSVTYNHEIMGPVVVLPPAKLGVRIQLPLSKLYTPIVMSKFVGLLGRVRRAKYVKRALDHANIAYGEGRKDLASYALAAANMDNMGPDFLSSLPGLWPSAQREVEMTLEDLKDDPRRLAFVTAMMGLRTPAVTTQPAPTVIVNLV